MSPPEPADRCKSCGRRLTDDVSCTLGRGPTCFRRHVAERIAAGDHVQLDLGLDLPEPEPRRRRELVPA